MIALNAFKIIGRGRRFPKEVGTTAACQGPLGQCPGALGVTLGVSRAGPGLGLQLSTFCDSVTIGIINPLHMLVN